MTDATNITHTSPHDWKYISEGGSTIVFSYAGAPHPDFDGTALRLRKVPVPSSSSHPDPDVHLKASQHLEEEGEGEEVKEEEPDDPTIVFQRTVIERLMPREHLPRLDAVRVERGWLQELAALTEPHRPPERRAKDTIDVHRRKAVLATDLVGGQGWAVEIKPKWGFLPAPTHLSPSTRDIKTRTCRFCMHAHLKRTTASSLGYCPLDLFSPAPARVERALHALWEAWRASGGAINNLKIFVQGRRLVPSDDPSSLAPLAAELLPSHPKPEPKPVSEAALRDAFTSTILPLLLSTPVLRTLGTLQRTLDALDVEGLSALWAARRGGDALGKGEREPDGEEWVRLVDMYLARHRQREKGEGVSTGEGEGVTGAEGEEEAEGGEEEGGEEELRYRLTAYLLSASFKDCSLIVRVPPNDAGAGGRAPTVTVIDLDVKSVGRLAKWAELDREIVEAYRAVDEPRVCVDDMASSA